MIYKAFILETCNDPNDPYSHKDFLGLWEKTDNMLSSVNWPHIKTPITDNDNIHDVIKETEICKIYFENPDPEMTLELVIEETSQERGVYYPRIYKNVCSDDDLSSVSLIGRDKRTIEAFNIPIDENLLINSLEQLNTLTELLDKILRTVFPNPSNFETYGFDIRNLIILSATEFEAQITGILKINEIKPSARNYTIIDFFKANEILRLSDYEVKFSRFPDIPTLSPFSMWISETSSKLEWYSNYNSIKHDREDNFHKARLIDLLNSISACYIILLAQYGNRPIINETLSNYWRIVKLPQFDVSEKLISPLKDGEWKIKKYNC